MAKIPHERIGEYLQAILRVLIEKGGSGPAREVIKAAESRLNLTPYEKELTPKNQNERWWALLQLFSINLVKAGWLRKNKAVWYITKEGEKALKMNPKEFIDESSRLYRIWHESSEPEEVKEKEDQRTEPLLYEQSLAKAREEIKNYIENLNPYEFQDLVAALLRGMGYYTPFIAAQGPDGGVDIIAYKDPLGAEGTKIKVQVKHRKDVKVSNQEVSSLNGILRNRDAGLIVSTGGFSTSAIREMRTSNNHIEKLDLDDFINLWEQYYDKLNDEDKFLLPLRRVYLLAPEE